MRLKRSRQNIVSINNYNIDGSTLEEVEHHPYLGVELGNDLNWTNFSSRFIILLSLNIIRVFVFFLSSCSCWISSSFAFKDLQLQ
jgi:hypothetical protein